MAGEPSKEKDPASRPGVVSEPARTVKFSQTWALVVVPLLLMAGSFWAEAANSPRWVAAGADINAGYDPDYAYLLNATNLAEGIAPRHIDHPGTPVQVLGAAVLRARHLLAGSGSLRSDVLADPDGALSAISIVLRVLLAGSLAGFGMAALRFTRSVALAVVAQAAPLASFTVLTLTHRVMPEPLLLSVSLLLAGEVLRAAAGGGGRTDLRSGLLMGLGLATKVTFAPAMIAACGVVAGGRRRRLWQGLAMVAALAVCLVPIASQMGRVGRWLWSLVIRDGRYGSSGGHLVLNPAMYFKNLWDMVAGEPLPALVSIAGLSFIAWLIATRRWRGLGTDGRRCGVALAAVALAIAAQYVLVAKHPGTRYLIPAIGLSGAGVVLTCVLARHVWVRPVGRWVGVGVGGLVGACLLVSSVEFTRWIASVNAAVPKHLEVCRAADAAAKEGAVIAESYSSSSPAFALAFADSYTGYRYTEDINKRYPNRLVYIAQSKLFCLGNRVVEDAQIAALAAKQRLYLHCLARMRPASFDYDVIIEAGEQREGLYRVILRSQPGS